MKSENQRELILNDETKVCYKHTIDILNKNEF